MGLILNIETSTSVCSVALAKDGEVIACKENNEGLNHSVLLGSYTDEILRENRMDVHQLDAIAVSMGPGSYTGLRIGVSLAKGLCYGTGKPLIAVPTLQALALSVSSRIQEEALYCPMIDARRMEVYTAVFDRYNHTVNDTQAIIIDSHSFEDLLATHRMYFFGNGSDKVKEVLPAVNAHYIEKTEISARHIASLSEQLWQEKKFVDVAYFEPFYLKDFIATTPRKKVI